MGQTKSLDLPDGLGQRVGHCAFEEPLVALGSCAWRCNSGRLVLLQRKEFQPGGRPCRSRSGG